MPKKNDFLELYHLFSSYLRKNNKKNLNLLDTAFEIKIFLKKLFYYYWQVFCYNQRITASQNILLLKYENTFPVYFFSK